MIGFHTDAFNSAHWDFAQCLAWAGAQGVPFIECGVMDGVSWAHGLGYYPHAALWQDPLALRREMERVGVRLSQVDAAFPLTGPEGPTLGVQYVLRSIRWAHLAGGPCVDTTDDRRRPDGMSDEEALRLVRWCYAQIVPVAARYGVVVNVEPHGYLTTRPVCLDVILEGFDPRWLRVNMDTGNTLVAGQDPATFLQRFADRIGHVHVKDVALAEAGGRRPGRTGIAISHCAVGEGVAVPEIRRCLRLLRQHGYEGVCSVECEGDGGPTVERSLRWLHAEMAAAGFDVAPFSARDQGEVQGVCLDSNG